MGDRGKLLAWPAIDAVEDLQFPINEGTLVNAKENIASIRTALLCLAILLVGGTYAAAGFNGKTLHMTEYSAASATATPGPFTDFGNAVIGPGIEHFQVTLWTTDISDSDILLTDSTTLFDFGVTHAAFYGDAFSDVLGNIDPIVGVHLIDTNIPGIDTSRFSFDADHVYLNFTGLQIIGNGSFVRVGVQFVPEPVTLVPIGYAVIGCVAARRRRVRI
jgi:hypothetical protein